MHISCPLRKRLSKEILDTSQMVHEIPEKHGGPEPIAGLPRGSDAYQPGLRTACQWCLTTSEVDVNVVNHTLGSMKFSINQWTAVDAADHLASNILP